MTATAGVLVASPLMDALAAAENAIRATAPAPDTGELRAAEARLRALLADVLAKLGGGLVPEGGTRKAGDDGDACVATTNTPECQKPRHGSFGNSPDALDEWYTDPWASANNTSCSRPRSRGGSGESPPSKRMQKNLVEMFSLEQFDDTQTEVATEAGGNLPHLDSLADMDDQKQDPHWQYGKCVAAKLVSLSPPGSSAFEQLLGVLMTIFDLPEQQRRGVLAARHNVNRCWSFGGTKLRALAE